MVWLRGHFHPCLPVSISPLSMCKTVKLNTSHLRLKIVSILRGIIIQAGAEATLALKTAMNEVGW